MAIYNGILLIVFIALSGFFSSIETAFFSLSDIKVKQLVKSRKKGAKKLEKLKSNPQRLLVTILIGNNIVNIGASALATVVALNIFENGAIALTTGIMTVIILIFGEITPKALAIKHNEKLALTVSGVITFLQTILFPIVIIFESFTKLVAGDNAITPVVTEKDIKEIVTIGKEAGEVKESEREFIHRIFKFDDLEAKDIMTPRMQIHGLEEKQNIKDAAEDFEKLGHSRLLVYREDLDHITGFIHVVDTISHDLRKQVGNAQRPILFISSSKKVDALLRFFQRKKQHIAVVVDDHGTNVGVVTMEDVLEEIVGEIVDETEKIDPIIRKAGNKYVVQGDIDMEEFSSKLHITIAKKDLRKSLSTYLIEKVGHVPEENQEVNFTRFKAKVKIVNKNKVDEVKISLKEKKSTPKKK